jgi:hypothetical protein
VFFSKTGVFPYAIKDDKMSMYTIIIITKTLLQRGLVPDPHWDFSLDPDPHETDADHDSSFQVDTHVYTEVTRQVLFLT